MNTYLFHNPIYKYLLFSLLLMFLSSTQGLTQCNHPEDYTALRALYLSTDGDNWTNNTGWPTRAQFEANPTPPAGTDMSGWWGFGCENIRVNAIIIFGNNLSGTIPDFKLHNLSGLWLVENQLKVGIPNFDLTWIIVKRRTASSSIILSTYIRQYFNINKCFLKENIFNTHRMFTFSFNFLYQKSRYV